MDALGIVIFSLATLVGIGHASSQDHIIYMGGTQGIGAAALTSTHLTMLMDATGSIQAMIYSYKHAFNGFSARLTDEEAKTISKLPGVLSVRRSQTLKLHTTHSWDFLGLTEAALNTHPSQDIIIGVIDTGIWPESPSFDDSGMGEVPARWKGACVNGNLTKTPDAVNCTKKIIGARYYKAGVLEAAKYTNARDENGHGTHTASTAAGRLVRGANVAGLGKGTARGGAPGARVAVYKVCWPSVLGTTACSELDVLAAFDQAVHDGVDVLSASIGGSPTRFSEDAISIGAFHAAERGIVVSCSAGNDGPSASSVSNGAPWIFTVGASTMDRNFINEKNKVRTVLPYKPAPVAATFSSRGPSSITPEIIKPDVTAPGVNIIAAYPHNIQVKLKNGTKIYVKHMLMSGTSMACPHVSGAAAYVKSFHPRWSPAAIRSALMTTATVMNNNGSRITDSQTKERADPFVIGSGEIQPAKATEPGLVYDLETKDYIGYLCSIGFTSREVKAITGHLVANCSKSSHPVSLNYPSIGFSRDSSLKVTRTATNVGAPVSVYSVHVEPFSHGNGKLYVEPRELRFNATGQKLSYSVTLKRPPVSQLANKTWIFSSLTWTDGKHFVRSPVAVEL